jgi:hypothetical protein
MKPQAIDPRQLKLNHSSGSATRSSPTRSPKQSQTVPHKRGAKWRGKIGRLRAEQRDVDRNIYRLIAATGIANRPACRPARAAPPRPSTSAHSPSPPAHPTP